MSRSSRRKSVLPFPSRSPRGRYYAMLLEARLIRLGETLTMTYRGGDGHKRVFRAVVRENGLEMEGEIFSPSYAALLCMRRYNEKRQAVDGRGVWKNEKGLSLLKLIHLQESQQG